MHKQFCFSCRELCLILSLFIVVGVFFACSGKQGTGDTVYSFEGLPEFSNSLGIQKIKKEGAFPHQLTTPIFRSDAGQVKQALTNSMDDRGYITIENNIIKFTELASPFLATTEQRYLDAFVQNVYIADLDVDAITGVNEGPGPQELTVYFDTRVIVTTPLNALLEIPYKQGQIEHRWAIFGIRGNEWFMRVQGLNF